jgi:hypothetical protein
MSSDSFCGDGPGGEVAVASVWPCSADIDAPGRRKTSRSSEASHDAAKLNRSLRRQRKNEGMWLKGVAEPSPLQRKG